MNDLAEKALEGLDVARCRLREHPMLSLAATGFVVGAMVVAAGGRATAARADRPLTPWLDLQDVRSEAISSRPGSIMLAGVLTLAVLWVAALWLVAVRAVPLVRVWWVAAAWAAPFALGPPLMDTTVYTYVAFGRLLRAGRNPYDVGPSALGDSPIVAAIDPAHRVPASSAGPLGTVLQHLAVSVGNGGLLTTVIVWRVIGVVAAVWIARSAAELAELVARARRAGATASVHAAPSAASAAAACALNPLLLFYVVSSPHLDAVMVALVLAALVEAAQRRWWRALALATLAGCVNAVALVVVALIAAVHWFGRRRSRVWPVVARDLVVVLVALAVPTLLAPQGWTWLRTARGQFASERTPYSVAGAIERGLSVVVRVASYDDLAAAGRLTAAIAAVCVVAYLLVTVRRRPLGLGVGYALLALALLAPVLHPWYLLWGLSTLLPLAAGRARIALVGLSVGACVLAPQGFGDLLSDLVTGGCLAVVAVAVLAALWITRPEPVEVAPALPVDVAS